MKGTVGRIILMAALVASATIGGQLSRWSWRAGRVRPLLVRNYIIRPSPAVLPGEERSDPLLGRCHGCLVLLGPVGDPLGAHDLDIANAHEAEDRR